MMGLECPQWFDDDARTAWREVLAEMGRRGIEILALDSTALSGYCINHARWARLTRTLAEHGSEKADKQSGHVCSFVQAQERQLREKIAREAWASANKMAALFFLSPADRIRIHNIPSASIPRRPRVRSGSRRPALKLKGAPR